MATRKRAAKKSKKDLAPQSDPQSLLDGAAFLSAAKPVLATLAKDLMVRAEASKAITQALAARYEADKQAKRTAEAYLGWRQAFVDQVAAAWLLSCVFIRVLEDRGLVGQARIAGPGAADSQHLFFQMGPSLTERDYLWTLFRELSRTPSAEALFDPRHNPVWLLGPSGEATKALLNLFRMPSVEAPAFRFGSADTRFLGDLYQDLNDDVKKRYALLQTPRFVERFILDRTLDRAIERFGLDEATLIDPTCGSGHFLLGAFDRLFERRRQAEPATDVRQVALEALDAVAGSDINPYAVAIARFRLTLAFLDKAELEKLSDAPRLPLHVVVADSLLHNPQLAQQHLKDLAGQKAEAWEGSLFALEDEKAAREVLYRRYSAVVGNPPYIVPKDKALRDRYRSFYVSAAMQYSLAAPFTERFFQLARDRGAVGMITANSFMKREFGKKLIQEFLPSVNLDLIINTSGAYIPGHGTPTVLLFGTNEPPQGMEAHVVLASRGEPTTPEDAELGFVWRSVADHWSEEGFENEFVSVARVGRIELGKHPWSLTGGGATDLKSLLEERAQCRLGDVTKSIGRVAHTGNDEAFVAPIGALRRKGLREDQIVPFVEGQIVRDWCLGEPTGVLFPYAPGGADGVCKEDLSDPRIRWLWPTRTMLWERREPNGTHREIGLTWYELSRFHPERFAGPGIAFAFVATHNHFVLDRGGKVFKQSAPIIKLPETATEDDHLALLAYLNSSTACFWMKQVFMNKGGSGIGRGIQDEEWESRFEFDGTKLGRLPLPPDWQSLVRLGKEMLDLATKLSECEPARAVSAAVDRNCDISTALNQAQANAHSIRQSMVAVQERLDWEVYALWQLWNKPSGQLSEQFAQSLAPGSRLFEIRLAASKPDTHWFERNGYKRPSVSAPSPQTKLSNALAASRDLRMIEQPEYKHRWSQHDFGKEVVAAAETYVLDGVERAFAGSITSTPRRIAADVALSPAFSQVAALCSAGYELTSAVLRLMSGEAVPFVAALRFSAEGLSKHDVWRQCWDLQRQHDAGVAVSEIAVPPKYGKTDFVSDTYWRLRGKLDVPKERFISYPGCESDEDNEPVYGWAGWDHLQQAQALAALYQDRKDREGWTADRLTPMLAGLLELLPWLLQWHNEPSDEFDGLQLGDYFQSYLDEQCRELGLTLDNLRDWRPGAKGRKKK